MTGASQGKRFALIGVAGYIARRHLDAIRDVGGDLVAAFDVSDSVGQMDASFPQARFFTHFEQFDAYVQTLRRRGTPVDYVSVCSPNFMHRSHAEFALRSGADCICEKPLVLDPGDIDALEDLEKETGRRVNTILQLRLNPANIALREEFARPTAKKHEVDLTYITARGQWYYESWKGDVRRSGGIATNIGVHFFDLLSFLFGATERNVVHHRAMDCAAGYLELERARVRWFLSINARDLPSDPEDRSACRRIVMGDRVCNLSGDFRELHTRSYQEVLAGRGFPMSTVRPSIATVADLRNAPVQLDQGQVHPFLEQVLNDKNRYRDGFPV
ncbi:MAG: Gfo/Idh/MocA family oxidoreductase [Hyphomicrobiaceae bacterium]